MGALSFMIRNYNAQRQYQLVHVVTPKPMTKRRARRLRGKKKAI